VRTRVTPHRLPKVLELAQVEALLDAPDPASPFLSTVRIREPLYLRDVALLETMFATGLRIAELVAVKVDDLDLERRELRVIGKGDKERDVLLNHHAADALRAYLADGREALRRGPETATCS